MTGTGSVVPIMAVSVGHMVNGGWPCGRTVPFPGCACSARSSGAHRSPLPLRRVPVPVAGRWGRCALPGPRHPSVLRRRIARGLRDRRVQRLFHLGHPGHLASAASQAVRCALRRAAMDHGNRGGLRKPRWTTGRWGKDLAAGRVSSEPKDRAVVVGMDGGLGGAAGARADRPGWVPRSEKERRGTWTDDPPGGST